MGVLRFALSASVALTIAGGCGSAEGENSQGQGSTAVEQPAVTIASPEESIAIIAKARTDWQETLAANAQDDPASHFDNLTEEEFLALVQSAAADYDFRLIEVQWLQPRQAAPLVVVEVDKPVSFASDTPAILRLLDPQAPGGEEWDGWTFEGFFLEARDGEGVPFLAAFNHWRGSDRGGGQWARSEDLYPFAHG